MASMRRDEALEPGEQAGHRVHLVMCRGCRRYSVQMNEVSAMLKRAGEDGTGTGAAGGMPAEVRERLKAKMGG
jgi:predicted anti-sigma-YlaC factor YlaD